MLICREARERKVGGLPVPDLGGGERTGERGEVRATHRGTSNHCSIWLEKKCWIPKRLTSQATSIQMNGGGVSMATWIQACCGGSVIVGVGPAR